MKVLDVEVLPSQEAACKDWMQSRQTFTPANLSRKAASTGLPNCSIKSHSVAYRFAVRLLEQERKKGNVARAFNRSGLWRWVGPSLPAAPKQLPLAEVNRA